MNSRAAAIRVTASVVPEREPPTQHTGGADEHSVHAIRRHCELPRAEIGQQSISSPPRLTHT
jgi:hypothetical protein